MSPRTIQDTLAVWPPGMLAISWMGFWLSKVGARDRPSGRISCMVLSMSSNWLWAMFCMITDTSKNSFRKLRFPEKVRKAMVGGMSGRSGTGMG